MNLKRSLLRTLRYTASFSFPLTIKESWYWLMTEQEVPFKSFKASLSGITIPKELRTFLISKISPEREQKRELTNQKLRKVDRAIKLLRKIPFIWYIGLTGSLSMDNPDPQSDVDLMLIVRPQTVWIVRPLVVFLLTARQLPVRFSSTSKVKDAICINLYMDASNLAVKSTKQNFYVAHEVLQVRSLFDRGGQYQAFLRSNIWVRGYFANAFASRHKSETGISENKIMTLLLGPVNFLLYIAQKAYMSGKITGETISQTQAFFHPNNPYKRLKAQVGLE